MAFNQGPALFCRGGAGPLPDLIFLTCLAPGVKCLLDMNFWSN